MVNAMMTALSEASIHAKCWIHSRQNVERMLREDLEYPLRVRKYILDTIYEEGGEGGECPCQLMCQNKHKASQKESFEKRPNGLGRRGGGVVLDCLFAISLSSSCRHSAVRRLKDDEETW